MAVHNLMSMCTSKQQQNVHCWRIYEALMYATGILINVLQLENLFSFNLKGHISHWINFLNVHYMNDHPFLFARTLWACGKLSTALTADQVTTHRNMILSGLMSSNSIVRISAVR